MRRIPTLLLAILGLAAAPAAAGDAAHFRNEAVRLELVLEGAPAEPGAPLRAAVLVDLEPGWTTYWRDPGEAGLAPALAFADGAGAPLAAEWRQPAPRRVAEGALKVNAFEGPTAFAVTLAAPPPEGGRVAATLLIGVCRQVCVPVAARLEAEVEAQPPLADRRAVRAAFAALPAPAPPGALNILPLAESSADALRVEARAEGDASKGADLFLAAPGWRFGPAKAVEAADGGQLLFDVPVSGRPTGAAPGARPEAVEAVLVLGGDAALAARLPVP